MHSTFDDILNQTFSRILTGLARLQDFRTRGTSFEFCAEEIERELDELHIALECSAKLVHGLIEAFNQGEKL